MSCHLHEITGIGFHVFPWLESDRSAKVLREFSSRLPNAVCFDAGDLFVVSQFDAIPDLVKLPYPVCWIEGVMEIENMGRFEIASMCWNSEGVMVGQAFVRVKIEGSADRKWFYWHTWRILDGGFVQVDDHEEGDERLPWFMRDKLVLVASTSVERFLSVLNCKNIDRIENKPSEKLQKARVKRGKQPLFSYWTLEINLPKSRAAGENYGGTHAAPRLHLRRGHPRQYAPGKWCWVQPHAVGNKSAGMVHKDYAVNHAPQ